MRSIRSYPALYLGLGGLIVGLDQATKFLAETYLSDGRVLPVFFELIQFRLAYNDAAAFSLGFGATWILALISVTAVIVLLWFSNRVKNISWAIIGGFVLGGAAGNGIDRVFKQPEFFNGHVVDFIQLPFNFPIFNLADTFLVIGVCLATYRSIRGDQIGGSHGK